MQRLSVGHHLILFFNEDYSKNIPILKQLYGSRFGQISYIVPDHYARLDRWYRYPGKSFRLANGCDRLVNRARRLLGRRNQHEFHPPVRGRLAEWPAIARVIGFKYYFQDFFWQARRLLLASGAEWFWFVADDLLLNPKINERNILEFFDLREGSRSVICEPYCRSDEWVNWFQGSSDRVIEKLRSVGVYAANFSARTFPDDPHLAGPNQRRVLGGCADFFGCHRDLLVRVLDTFHALALRKVFVEIAIPNVLLSLDKNPTLISGFEWEFDTGRGNSERIRNFIANPGNKAFYHPVKFGILEPELAEDIAEASAS